jgi:hypothetical protein
MSHEQYIEVIDALNQCVTDCIHCGTSCLKEENVKGMIRCITLDRECAEICIYTSKMLASDSEFSGDILNLCSKICSACGDECGKHASHMEHCRICAESCRKCAAACRQMVRVNA